MPAVAALRAHLTAREWETALLVAEGLTDRQIASRLLVSERTVHAHLRAVYTKARARNRVQVVNWLAQLGLTPRGTGDD